jgi:hypothetical protein
VSTSPSRLCLTAVVVCSLTLAGSAQQGPPFSQDEMKRWLTYLSSDELEGRQVFTEGLGLAAAYIADRLKESGVAPAGDNGTYFQTVKVLGMRTRSNSRVTVTVGSQSRTFADGQGVTFPRNQGARQMVSGRLEFVGYGHTFAPLQHDDYAGRDMQGRVALYIGTLAPGMTAAHNRLTTARPRVATEMGAVGAVGPAPTPAGRGRGAAPAPPNAPGRGNTPAANPQAVDFQTAQGVDLPIAPQITAGDEFYEFVLAGSGHTLADLRALAAKQQPLPRIDLKDASITFTVDADYDLIQTRLTRNVVARVDGTDARLRGSYVVLGAHYDHVGYQQFAGTTATTAAAIASCPGQTRPTPRPGDLINNGADDDGSGTVALMAIAKAFANGAKPKRSLLFVWHTGEEGGLFGSRYMAAHPIVPIEQMAAQLNIDMIGRNRCDDPAEANTVYVVGSDRISSELHNVNEDANASLPAPLTLNYELNDPSDLESIYTRSDHYSYASRGVPIVFYHTGLHRDYHFVTDEIDRIEFGKIARIAQLVHATAMRVGNLDRPPARDNRGPRIGKEQTGRVP